MQSVLNKATNHHQHYLYLNKFQMVGLVESETISELSKCYESIVYLSVIVFAQKQSIYKSCESNSNYKILSLHVRIADQNTYLFNLFLFTFNLRNNISVFAENKCIVTAFSG